MANTDKLRLVGKPGTATTLSAPGHTLGGTSITVGSTTNWPTTTGVTFAIDRVTVSGSTETQVAGSYTIWVGDVTGATTIANMTLHADSPNSDQDYPAGSTTRVYIPVSTATHNDMVEALLESHDQDGTLKAGAVDSTAVLADGIVTRAKLATAVTTELNDGWTTPTQTVSSVTNNGNRSYDVVFNSTVASVLSPGMRLRTTRTVAAPTQCADLEASSSQYFSKTSPNKLTFTDDFTCSAWVKLESYGAVNGIIARRNADTEGWSFEIDASGKVQLNGLRIAGNFASIVSYQSIPLNKWVHVAATLDMSGATGTVYIDGVLVPSLYSVSGTATALVQGTTALVVGAQKSAGSLPFDGKIAQAAVFGAVLSASTIRSYMSQTLSGSETNLLSAYSCNNSLLDLNTTTPNDLTASGGAAMTNADSPFGQDSNGVTAGTTDYALVMKVSTTTATVQVPEGCTIPTSGGVSAVAYSTTTSPFGFTLDKGRWEIRMGILGAAASSGAVTATTYNPGGVNLNVPTGAWELGYELNAVITPSAAFVNLYTGLSTSSSTFLLHNFSSRVTIQQTSTSNALILTTTRRGRISVLTATPYFVLMRSDSAFSNMSIRGDLTSGLEESNVYAIPAGI